MLGGGTCVWDQEVHHLDSVEVDHHTTAVGRAQTAWSVLSLGTWASPGVVVLCYVCACPWFWQERRRFMGGHRCVDLKAGDLCRFLS